MRRILLAFLLTLTLAAGAQSPSDSSTKLRQAADKLLATGSSEDAVKAADLFDKASQMDAREEAAKKPDTNSGWLARFIAFTPTLSVFALVLNYWLTNKQTRFTNDQAILAEKERREEAARQRADAEREAIRKREDDEKMRFTDAVTLIQKVEDFSPAAAVLSTFAAGPYAELARHTGARLLIGAKSFSNFTEFFNSFVEPVSRKNLIQVVDLFRTIHAAIGPYLNKIWVDGVPDLTRLSPTELENYKLLQPERIFLGNRTATILRLPRESDEVIDLSNLGFDSTEMRNADLRNAYIDGTGWDRVSFEGADLRGITGYRNASFYNAAWWLARHIDQPFLDYLTEKYAFTPDEQYYVQKQLTAESYAEDLARLKTSAP